MDTFQEEQRLKVIDYQINPPPSINPTSAKWTTEEREIHKQNHDIHRNTSVYRINICRKNGASSEELLKLNIDLEFWEWNIWIEPLME
jgi:hypothetical protein